MINNIGLYTLAIAGLALINEVAISQHNYEEAKNITMQSLENKRTSVKIIYNHPDESINISIGSKDTIWLKSCMNSPKIKKLANEHFLELDFMTLGGSWQYNEKSALICISNGKLYTALYCNSLSHFEARLSYGEADRLYYENDLYQATLLSVKVKSGKFQLFAKVRDYVKSEKHPNENKNIIDTINLSFDLTEKVFMSNYAHFQGENNCPSFAFGEESYFFSHKQWYCSERTDSLEHIFNENEY